MAQFDPFGSDFEHLFVNSSPDHAPRHVSRRLRPIENMSAVSRLKESFRERRDRLQHHEDEKNQLLDDLISQLEATQQALAQAQIFRAQAATMNININDLEEQLKQIEKIVDRNPYVTILIDGNHLSFTQPLVKQGEEGGRIAAERLHQELMHFALNQIPDVKMIEFKLRMYIDPARVACGLTELLPGEREAVSKNFVKGFNGSKYVFDIVDVCSDEGVQERKLIQQLHMDLYNCHCRHIIVGGFVGESYMRVLQDIADTSNTMARLSILESASQQAAVPTTNSPVNTIIFDDLFYSMDCLLIGPKSPELAGEAIDLAAPVLARVESSSTASLQTPSASASSTPQLTWAGLAGQPVLATAAESSMKITPTAAAAANAPSAKPKTAPLSRKAPDYNRSGQRIDKHDSASPYHEVTRIKKMKLCNSYYLLGPSFCTMSNCNHRHDYAIKDFERKILGEVARMTPCYHKLDCKDADCLYGHRCPQSKPDENSCYYGEECRFRGWGHGIDTKVTKANKV